MNQKNLDFLKDQIKFTGFGETLESMLNQKLQLGENEFKISHDVKYGNDTLNTVLNFKKSDQNDMYFFNSYKAILQKEGSKKGALEQVFYINKDNNITVKEAYNLLDGRAVNKDLRNKEGELYNSWIKMDFKNADTNGNFKLNHYHQNYGYDLEASLSKHPIKELENSKSKEDLLNSLKKGNIQSVTFVIGGIEKKQFVEANPHFKTINVYDSSMQRISSRESKDEKKSESQSKGRQASEGRNAEAEREEAEGKEKGKKKSRSNSL